MGRVFTPMLGKARSSTRRHEDFARAVDLKLALLRHQQHEIATRSAAALANRSAGRGFSFAAGP
jgi:hypothetical protein